MAWRTLWLLSWSQADSLPIILTGIRAALVRRIWKRKNNLYLLSSFNISLHFFPGAISHYFGLAHSFWAMCFVANTYGVIIHHNKAVFRHPVKIHLIQSVLGWLVPAMIVGSCVFLAPPGYKFYFMDLMTAGMASIRMAYFAVTLPMQITLGVSLCLLWSIVWHLRKVNCF